MRFQTLEELMKIIFLVPGQDYPIFGEVPGTSFLCDGRSPGYYADKEVQIVVNNFTFS